MVSRRDEQERRGVGADSVEGEKAGSMRPHEGNDELVEALKLRAGELSTPSSSRSAMRVA